MVYGFNENKGKVDIDAILDELEANYQGNIDTLYNAIVAKGVTPASKSPADIAASIVDVYNKAQSNCSIITYDQISETKIVPTPDGITFTVNTGHSDATGVFIERTFVEPYPQNTAWSGYAGFGCKLLGFSNGIATIQMTNSTSVTLQGYVYLRPYKLNKS